MRSSIADMASGAFVFLVAAIFYYQSGELEGISLLFPQILVVFLTIGGIYLMIKGFLTRKRGTDRVIDDEPVAIGRVAQISLGAIAYAIATPFLGFYPATMIFLFVMGMILNDTGVSTRKSAIMSAALMIIVTFAVWAGFAMLLSVPTPESIFFE